jgi:hypothetical protein
MNSKSENEKEMHVINKDKTKHIITTISAKKKN